MGAIEDLLIRLNRMAEAQRAMAQRACEQARKRREGRRQGPSFGRKVQTSLCDRLFQRLDIEIRKLTDFQSRSKTRKETLDAIKKKQNAIRKQLEKYGCFKGGRS